jgi:hypothetical protein
MKRANSRIASWSTSIGSLARRLRAAWRASLSSVIRSRTVADSGRARVVESGADSDRARVAESGADSDGWRVAWSVAGPGPASICCSSQPAGSPATRPASAGRAPSPKRFNAMAVDRFSMAIPRG